MSKKIPFKISARTARLIGRQNFPNAEGAIIELVKNSYDADARICIVIFDNRFIKIPMSLTDLEYHQFSKQESLVAKNYSSNPEENIYRLADRMLDPINEQQEEIKIEKQLLHEYFRSKCKLVILDNGEGMTNRIIEDTWMTIGTNNKEVDIFTRTGRVKTGAKGIGRFALDKLGDAAEMLTKPDPIAHCNVADDKAFLWQVDWNAFEGNAKTLNQVEASLIEIDNVDFSNEIEGYLSDPILSISGLNFSTFKTGTRIEITALRDEWDDSSVGRLFNNLEVLIPPREERVFDILVYSTLKPEAYGQVAPAVCDDYDYKVEANVDAEGKAEITIHRKEFDSSKFPATLFSLDAMKKVGFTKEDIKMETVKVTKTIRQLVPGLGDADMDNTLDNIGAFNFVFYFMKVQTTKKDSEVFLYKDFNSATRKAWFEHFGGIKLFRDNFRVRPYGEMDNPAFDWLQLGERASRSPSSIGQQRTGNWLVRPSQISGVINISRLTNINFEDTSSRYGLQENKSFEYFSRVITGILDVFEKDRTHMGRTLRAYYEKTHEDEFNEDIVQDVKKRVRQTERRRKKSRAEEDAVALLKVAENLEEQIEELRDESNLLRILASNGLLVASFTHELKNIKDNLVFRIDELKRALQPVVDPGKISLLPDFKNPFSLLEVVKREDEKLKEWLYYTLETLRRDRRRQKHINLVDYFTNFRSTWESACKRRGIRFDLILPHSDEIKIKAFEAYLDSIFNNLLINSFEAFLRRDAPSERLITIKLEVHELFAHVIYTDSGPGLSTDINDPNDIFEPHFTTKKDPYSGEDIGTGLGMWLTKSFVTENNGEIDILNSPVGFGVSIRFFEKVL